MYITYSIYRSRNNDFIDKRKISLPIGDFRQLLNLDGIIVSVIEKDISTIPMIKKFGRAYIGNIQCEQFEIIDDDNTDAMNEKQFREYFKEISDVPLIWSKKESVEDGEQDTNKESKHKARKEDSTNITNTEEHQTQEQHLL